MLRHADTSLLLIQDQSFDPEND